MPWMNASIGPLLGFVVPTSAAAILSFVVWPTLARARRGRRLATVDLLLATSYIGTSRGDGASGASGAPRAPMDPVGPTVDEGPLDEPQHDGHRSLLDAGAFDAIVAHEDAREERYRRPTTVVVLELDGLDRLIERLGTDAADRIEPDVADTLAKLARRADYVARLGPGRFAVLMPETDEIVAINYVERIRQACDQWLESGAIAMRLAIGWASTAGSASVTTAMQVAVDRLHAEMRRHARQNGDGPGDALTA
jgi:diguanylate cyclase (GGDEF)-like protein